MALETIETNSGNNSNEKKPRFSAPPPTHTCITHVTLLVAERWAMERHSRPSEQQGKPFRAWFPFFQELGSVVDRVDRTHWARLSSSWSFSSARSVAIAFKRTYNEDHEESRLRLGWSRRQSPRSKIFLAVAEIGLGCRSQKWFWPFSGLKFHFGVSFCLCNPTKKVKFEFLKFEFGLCKGQFIRGPSSVISPKFAQRWPKFYERLAQRWASFFGPPGVEKTKPNERKMIDARAAVHQKRIYSNNYVAYWLKDMQLKRRNQWRSRTWGKCSRRRPFKNAWQTAEVLASW